MSDRRRRTDLGRTARRRDTYTVVRCHDCHTLWVHQDLATQETADCPRCGTTHPEPTLDAVYTTDEYVRAVGARAEQLARDAGEYDAYSSEWPTIAEQRDQALAQIKATSAQTALRGPAVSPDSDYDPRDELSISPFTDAQQAHLEAEVHRLAAQQGPPITEPPRPPAPPVDVDDRPGVRATRPGDQLSVPPTVVLAETPPQRRDWLPSLQEDLLGDDKPGPIVDAMRTLLREHAPADLDAGRCRHDTTALISDLLERPSDGASNAALLEAEHYLESLAEYTVRFADRDPSQLAEWEREDRQQLRDELTRIATGTGTANAGLEALVRGPIDVQQAATGDAPTIRVRLDAPAWRDVRRQTAIRSLATLSTLGLAYDVEVVLSSPGLEDTLHERWTAWSEAALSLSEDREWDGAIESLAGENGDGELALAAQDAVDELPSGSRKVELLARLNPADYRTVKMLREDPTITAADGSIDAYLSDLEALDLVRVEPAHPSNRVHVTRLGERVQACIGSDDRTLRSPVQQTLDASLSETCTLSVGAVYGAGGAVEEPPTAGDHTAPDSIPQGGWVPEAIVADTSSPDDGGDYVQWLNGVDPRRPDEEKNDVKWQLHRRYTDVARDAAVTLVDDRQLRELEDGRVAYISGPMKNTEADALVMAQWGGPLPTLGRIAGALLSNKAWSKLLADKQLGHDLSNLDHAVRRDLDESLQDVITYGHQVGWIGDEQDHWDGLRDRLGGVRAALLEQVGELATSEDYDQRGELMESLHGLIASATQLYYAAGLDLVINVRLPDTANIAKDETRHRDLLDFFKYTVPKQTAYRHHSGYRMILEDREDKLKQRLGYSEDLDPSEPRMDWTARFVLSGPTATEFRDGIASAMAAELREARDDVLEGEEETAVMELPVAIGNSYAAIRDLVKTWVEEKEYLLGSGRGGPPSAREVARLLLRALGTTDGELGRANPYAVVETFLRMARPDRADYLRVHDLEAGLVDLPEGRLLQAATPSERAVVRTLLLADEPLRRSTIIDEDHADISGRSYDEYIDGLEALGIVHEAEADGRTGWTATLAPWWTEHRSRAGTAGLEAAGDLPDDPDERELLAALLERAGEVIPTFPEGVSLGSASAAELCETFAAPERWRPVIANGLPTAALSVPPPVETDGADVTVVAQGSPPATGPGSQSTLDAAETARGRPLSGLSKTRSAGD